MNAATYPEADHTAIAIPTINSTPAAPPLFWRFWIALVTICLAGPGATAPRLSISGCVADGPISPNTATSASRAGKIDRIP
jgi:hypothetical protein